MKKSTLFVSITAILIFLLIWLIYGWVKLLIVLFFVGVIGYILFFLYKKYLKKSNEEIIMYKFEEELIHVQYFMASQKFISPDFSLLIALDEQTESLCFIERKILTVKSEKSFKKYEEQEVFNRVVLSYKDLLQSEIVEDGAIITTTVRGSQIGGTLVSGLLADGMGSIIGSLSANSTANTEVKNIQLKLVVNDTHKPIYFFPFMKEQAPIEKNNDKFKNAMDQVNHWHGVMSVLIKRADESSRNVNYFFGVQHRDVEKIN